MVGQGRGGGAGTARAVPTIASATSSHGPPQDRWREDDINVVCINEVQTTSPLYRQTAEVTAIVPCLRGCVPELLREALRGAGLRAKQNREARLRLIRSSAILRLPTVRIVAALPGATKRDEQQARDQQEH